LDFINYSFRTPEGYIFSGVNEANRSQTERLIGRPNGSGEYKDGRVEYLPTHPEWHRLKGWGYGGFGPPGSLVSMALRALIALTLMAFCIWYSYSLASRAHAQ
jgi:hypothetical protein